MLVLILSLELPLAEPAPSPPLAFPYLLSLCLHFNLLLAAFPFFYICVLAQVLNL